jgi:uncharacterized coiled-coil protein SlyX
VRYEAVNAMLLNEFLKEHRKGQEQDLKIKQQDGTISELKVILAQQRKDFEALAARVEAQSAQIHKVSDQVQLGNAVSQRVVYNQ